MSIWFNARVLVCEDAPRLVPRLQAARARVTWAPLTPQPEKPARGRVLEGDWADPDFPYRLVEGHEIVLLRWPDQDYPAEMVRWWLSAAMHLAESARRYRVRALGFSPSPTAPPLLRSAGEFLSHYLTQGVVAEEAQLLEKVEAALALQQP